MLFRRRRKKDTEIYPDEIFLDSSNLPRFDVHQFEGRIEKPISKQTVYIAGLVFVCIGIVLAGKLWSLQMLHADHYRALSENNRLAHSFLFAERGVIFDRTGKEISWNAANAEDTFSKRVYDERSGLSHVLGYVQYPQKDRSGNFYQTEITGKAGVEKSFEELLGGENGLKIVETNAHEDTLSESTVRTPKNGENLTLSIDSGVQHALYVFMEDLSQSAGFEGGAGVLMDVTNGEMLALASFPEYRSQSLTNADSDAIASYQTDGRKPFLNRATAGLYTPGSIVKPFIALGALQEDVAAPNTLIESTGSIAIPHPYIEGVESVFTDWKAHGVIDLTDAIAHSSNVYFYILGGGYQERRGLGIANIERFMRLFGFGEHSGIQLSPEEKGTIPNPTWKKEAFADGVWRIGDTYNTAIGQYGFQVTPIQAVRAIAAIANSGKLLVPTLVRDDTVAFDHVTVRDEHFAVVREGMRQAVTEGTAGGLWLPNVQVAAKTGTAELGSKKQFVNSWVIGFFPYEEPRYAFAVIMERGPRENLVGALFVMRQLFEWMSTHTPEYLENKK